MARTTLGLGAGEGAGERKLLKLDDVVVPARLLRPRVRSVSYNHRGLLFDGEPTLWVSGSMHYQRFTPGLWPNALRLAKEANMNGITSYVMWNLHEPLRGQYDFTGQSNVSAFLQAAHDAGLMVHLRFGPYIDGEWDYGGFPSWVNSAEANMSCLRCSDSNFKSAMSSWMKVFIKHVRPFFITNGGPS